MRPRIERKLSADEFFWLAAEDAKELVDGEILPMTPTFFQHGRTAGRLVRALQEHAEQTGAGEVVTAEVGFVTRRNPDRVRAPDVAFVSRERLAGRDLDEGFFEGAPDLAVEILSPGDRAIEIQAKVDEYLAAGARLVWIVDPKAERLTVHRSKGSPSMLGLNDVVDGEDVLPGFRLALGKLFRR